MPTPKFTPQQKEKFNSISKFFNPTPKVNKTAAVLAPVAPTPRAQDEKAPPVLCTSDIPAPLPDFTEEEIITCTVTAQAKVAQMIESGQIMIPGALKETLKQNMIKGIVEGYVKQWLATAKAGGYKIASPSRHPLNTPPRAHRL